MITAILITAIVLETLWIIFSKKIYRDVLEDIRFLKNRLTGLETEWINSGLSKTIISRLNTLELKAGINATQDLQKIYKEAAKVPAVVKEEINTISKDLANDFKKD